MQSTSVESIIFFALWLLLPMLLGVVLVAISGVCFWKVFSIGHGFTFAFVVLSVAWCEMLLFELLRGAWPTFVPHIGLALIFLLVAGQMVAAIERAA